MQPRLLISLLACALASCSTSSAEDRAEPPVDDYRSTPGYVVDSAMSMEEQLRRFRLGMSRVDSLVNSAASLQELASTFFGAVVHADTARLLSLRLTLAEYAYLYFPESVFSREPYEMPPGLLWFQINAESKNGLTKLMSLLTNTESRFSRLECPAEPISNGAGRIWERCSTVWTAADSTETTALLFGTIFEWNGRYKLVSFANSY